MKKKYVLGFVLMLSVGGVFTFDLMSSNAATAHADTNLGAIKKLYDVEEEFFSKPMKDVDYSLKDIKYDSLEIKNSIIINNDKINSKKDEINNKVKITEKKIRAEKELNKTFNTELDLKTKNENIVIDDDYYSEETMVLLNSEFKDKSKYSNQVRYYVTIAKEQKQNNNEASEALKKVFDNDQVISIDKELISEVKEKIDNLPESKFKQSLLSKLSMVIDQQLKEEAVSSEQIDIPQETTPETTQSNTTTEEVIAPNYQQEETITTTQSTPKAIDTSGFYARGISAPLSTYSADGGQVPTYTPYAYLWTNSDGLSNYYLIDNSNSLGLGGIVLSLTNGEIVYLNNQSYTVTGSQVVYYGQDTSVIHPNHKAYLQTCLGNNPSVDGMRVVFLD